MIGLVELENVDGGSTYIGQTNNRTASECEVIRPSVESRMKEASELLGLRIKASDISALVSVTRKACETEV